VYKLNIKALFKYTCISKHPVIILDRSSPVIVHGSSCFLLQWWLCWHSSFSLFIMAVLVFQFFSPLVPVKVEFEYNASGKPTGEANVDFSTHQEAKEAMKKHKANMRELGTVAVILQFQSEPFMSLHYS